MSRARPFPAPRFLSIGHVAKLLGVSTRTLTNYERDGKIPRARRNALNGRRIYTQRDLRLLQRIFQGDGKR